MRTSGGISASCLPSGSVWTSEPLRCQYSLDDCVWNTLGTVFVSRDFCRMPSVLPLSGSVDVAVGEREIVGGEQVLVVLAVGPRRRGEAVVERAQAAAGDVRDHAVEDLAALLVGVEAVPEEMPQAASALRRAEAQRPRLTSGLPAAVRSGFCSALPYFSAETMSRMPARPTPCTIGPSAS